MEIQEGAWWGPGGIWRQIERERERERFPFPGALKTYADYEKGGTR
jgi:hypothetical protein